MFLKPVEKVVNCSNHCIFFYEAGDPNGEVVIFVHGWPELSASWRHQLPTLALWVLGPIAPDMRGYGVDNYESHGDYAQEYGVWVICWRFWTLWVQRKLFGWACLGEVPRYGILRAITQTDVGGGQFVCAYHTLEYGLESCLPLVDRKLYPESDYPFGQWEYQRFMKSILIGPLLPSMRPVPNYQSLISQRDT
ncbi:MAG: hypothetical protein CM1200mP4_0940 [Rhodospirillaceae bacterium]|nr:MAG: hypothetical protein CM1200mP4_0940 [Rhodospirillaceae bacterium]